MFAILETFVVGLFLGLIARAVTPGDDKLGWIMTAVLGIAGLTQPHFHVHQVMQPAGCVPL